MEKKSAVKFGIMLFGVLLIGLFAFLALHFYINYSKLSKEYKETLNYYKNKTQYLEGENAWLKKELNKSASKLNNLSKKVSSLNLQLQNLSQAYNACLSKPPKIVNRTIIINPLNFSKWFKGMSFDEDIFYDLTAKCSSVKELSLPCVDYWLQREYVFYSTESPDPFLPPKEALTERKGDCEEFSTLLWTYLERLKSFDSNKRIELMKKAKPYELMSYVIFSNSTTTITQPNYKGYLLGKVSEYDFGMACYSLNETQGHCGLVISRKPLKNVSDFIGAILVDSKTGAYLGKIGIDFPLCEGNCFKKNTIWVLMYNKTLVKWENNGWKTYS